MLTPRSGSSAPPEGLGSCCAPKGLQGRNQPGAGFVGGGQGAGEGKESSGEAGNWGQAKGFLLGGTPEDQALLGDGSLGDVAGREQRERCRDVEAEMVCAGGERAEMGA